jgi:disulfide bond formation protein DsbB
MLDLYNFSKNRISWALLAFSGLAFIVCGLYFEHYMGLAPCHLCIVQRIAFLIIGLGAFIPLINPENTKLRYTGLFTWFSGASLGVYAAGQLVYIQDFKEKSEDLFSMSGCSISANDMIANFPFLEWFPMLFNATGSCDKSSWNFYGIATMEQLTLLIFTVYALFFFAVFYKNIKR